MKEKYLTKEVIKVLTSPVMTDSLQDLPNGMYSATDSDRKTIYIFRQKGEGWIVKTPTHHNWYECVDYNEDGEQEGVFYEEGRI